MKEATNSNSNAYCSSKQDPSIGQVDTKSYASPEITLFRSNPVLFSSIVTTAKIYDLQSGPETAEVPLPNDKHKTLAYSNNTIS